MILVGDSIIQRMHSWEHNKRGRKYTCDVVCYRGCTTNRLTSKLERSRLNIAGYDKIIVHIGTNDIMSKELAELKIDFLKLLVEIQAHNSRATIIFSLPIPRPRDLPQSWPTQDTLNKWIIRHQRDGNYKAWRTYMTFLNKRSTILDPPTIKKP